MGNHNSGRRPQPTALKVLRGNPGKRPLNAREPQPPAGEVVKPAQLSSAAGVVWDAIAPACLAMGTLTTADVTAFRTLCELQSTFDLNCGRKDGDPANFSAKEERDTAAALRPYYEKFGLEPVGRARISIKKDVPVSKWEGLVG
jgi:hypothetical protein